MPKLYPYRDEDLGRDMKPLFLTSLALSVCLSSQAFAQAPTLSEQIETMRVAYGVSNLGVTVVSGQDVVLAQGFGTFETADASCGLYSATKALTALTLASMVEDAQIDLETPLGVLLEDAPDRWTNIPLWRLYNHTSGIAMIFNQDFDEGQDTTNRDIYNVVRTLPLDFEPGAHSRYQQSGYAIAEMIQENEQAMSWPELVHQHLTGPAGADETEHALLADGEKTAPMLTSAGFFRTSPADMARIFQALNAGVIADQNSLTQTLFDPRYVHEGYGLGVILEDVAGVPTLGHRGGGARANLRYAPSAGVGVMACTDQQINQELTIHVSQMIMDSLLTGEPPRLHIAVQLLSDPDLSATELVARFESEFSKTESAYSFDGAEAVINRMGYERLDTNPQDAFILFALNTRSYPQSANTWDSLADSQLALGQAEDAFSSMQRALSLQPGNPYLQARVAEHDPDQMDN